MNTYVIDTSVAVKWYIPKPLSDAALYYLELYRQEQARLLAPDLLIVEMGNVLWKKVRQNELIIQDFRWKQPAYSFHLKSRINTAEKAKHI